MSKQVTVKEGPAIGWLILGWLLVMCWRFFTGAHMNGQTYFDTLFFKDASRIYARKQVAFSKWKRTARIKRLWWRNIIFWPCFWLSYGWYVAPWDMWLITFWTSPLWIYCSYKKLQSVFFEVHTAGFSDGKTQGYWVLRRRWRWLRFGWLRDEELLQPVVVKEEETEEKQDIHIRSLKLLLDPGDDEGGEA